MLEQEIVFSEERNSWNLIVNGEWYAEAKISEFGSQKAYEQMEEMYENNLQCELEEESYDPEAKYEDAYRRNEEFPGINYDDLYEED